MNLTLRLLAILMVATLTLSSCVSKKKFQQLQDEKTAMANSLAESQKQINNLEGQVSTLQTDMASQKSKFETDINGLRKDVDGAKMDADKARKAAAERDAELARIKKEIKDAFGLGSDVAVTNQNGEMVVTLADPVNYASGSAKLNRQSRKSVEALAKTLNNNPSMHLLIEGHADSDKYPGNGYNNWDLSVSRSMNVVKRLVKLGVKPEQLTVAGRGDSAPAAPNDNKANKARNRRTEAKPSPKTGAIYQIGN
ncbi:MAG: OmpA family protein [Saprospiraceae bacterium]|nr:OmpA family protein [Saprospiraceae bacterium]